MGDLNLGELIGQLGAMGTFVIVFMALFFHYLGKRKDRKNGVESTSTADMFVILRDLQREVSDLHQWHNKEDNDGVKVWYVRQSLEDAIIKMTDSVQMLSESTGRSAEIMKNLYNEMRDTKQEIQKIKKT